MMSDEQVNTEATSTGGHAINPFIGNTWGAEWGTHPQHLEAAQQAVDDLLQSIRVDREFRRDIIAEQEVNKPLVIQPRTIPRRDEGSWGIFTPLGIRQDNSNPGSKSIIEPKKDVPDPRFQKWLGEENLLEVFSSLDNPPVVRELIRLVYGRDEIIHDLLTDQGKIDQDALPPNVLRQENEALRARIVGLEKQLKDYADTEEKARRRQQELRDDARWHF